MLEFLVILCVCGFYMDRIVAMTILLQIKECFLCAATEHENFGAEMIAAQLMEFPPIKFVLGAAWTALLLDVAINIIIIIFLCPFMMLISPVLW